MLSVRAAFLSDLHLGSRWCRARELSAFLDCLECDVLYLVGDIVDGWSLKRNFNWPSSHAKVLGKILDTARKSRVVYVTGNHDAFMDEFAGQTFGNLEVCLSAIHETRLGVRFAVFHGDEVDRVTTSQPLLAHIGDLAYSAALWANRGINFFRKGAGLEYRSFSQGLKQKVKEAVNYISGFEKKLVREARIRGTDGVICGHIHKAAWETALGTIPYGNCGDWVESCSALVEQHDGSIELLDWESIRETVGVPIVTRRGEMVFRFPLESPSPSWASAFSSMGRDPVETPGFLGPR